MPNRTARSRCHTEFFLYSSNWQTHGPDTGAARPVQFPNGRRTGCDIIVTRARRASAFTSRSARRRLNVYLWLVIHVYGTLNTNLAEYCVPRIPWCQLRSATDSSVRATVWTSTRPRPLLQGREAASAENGGRWNDRSSHQSFFELRASVASWTSCALDPATK